MPKYTGVYRTSPKTATYYFKISLGQISGKQRFITRGGFGLAKEAFDARQAELNRIKIGGATDPGRTTVADFAQHWSSTLRVAPTTISAYRCQVTKHIVPGLGAIKLRDLKPGHVSEFYKQVESERRLGKTSIWNLHRVLTNVLNAAVMEGLLTMNPASRVANKPKRPTTAGKSWSLEEAQAFAKRAADHYAYAAWLMLLTASTRRGEAIGVRWRDVDLDAGTVAIVQPRVLAGGVVYESEGKTAGSRRSIFLDSDMVGVLRKQRLRQAEWRLAAGCWADGGYVFTYPTSNKFHRAGEPLKPALVSSAFVEMVKKLGLPRIRLYDLRHTSASLALLSGIHPKVVQERLGHSNIRQTLDTYSHVVPGLHKAAADQLGAKIFATVKRERDEQSQQGDSERVAGCQVARPERAVRDSWLIGR